MLPLALFRSRSFTGTNLITMLLYGALGAAMFFFPLVLIQVHGYSATAAGAAMLPFILILFLFSRGAGGLADRFGARRSLILGPAITAIGFAAMARPGIGGSYWSTFFPAVVLMGVGMAITIAPLTTTVMNAVATNHAGIASGVNNAVSRVAGLLAIALLGILMLSVFDQELDRRLARLRLAPETVAVLQAERSKLGAAEAPESSDPSERRAVRQAVAGSFVAGFRWVALVAAGLALAAAATAAVTIPAKPEPAR